MTRSKIDPYYRDFPCTAEPARTPFRRTKLGDAGMQFIYMTNKRIRWSLLLDPQKGSPVEEAREIIPVGYSQLWLFEKIYSAPKPGKSARLTQNLTMFQEYSQYPSSLDRTNWAGRLFVLLREPSYSQSTRKPVIGYYVDRDLAIEQADLYSRMFSCKSIIGLMLADCFWH